MEEGDEGGTMIRRGVSGWVFLLVPAYPGCPGSKAIKRSLLLLFVVVLVAECQESYNPSHCRHVNRYTCML